MPSKEQIPPHDYSLEGMIISFAPEEDLADERDFKFQTFEGIYEFEVYSRNSVYKLKKGAKAEVYVKGGKLVHVEDQSLL